MKLEAGKKYIRRDGKVVGPIKEFDVGYYRFKCGTNTWNIYGYYYDEEDQCGIDLIAEYTEPATSAEYERGIKDAAKWMLDNLSAHEARMMLNELL